MLKNVLTFSNLTLFTALSLSSVAAWFAIAGLVAIFPAQAIAIIIMGGIIEIAKIVATVWLRKYWHQAGWQFKLLLIPMVVVSMTLTSLGTFGFLSGAHSQQSAVSGDVAAKVAIIDEKIKVQRDNIDIARKSLSQMDAQVEARLSRSDNASGAERAVIIRRQQAQERNALLKEIADAQNVIAKLNEERAPIASQLRKVETEVGPIKYIAALIYGDNPDVNTLERAVRWVIILLVIVFDPLAIALVLAANASKEWDKEKEDEEGDSPLGTETAATPTVTEPAYEPDDGPLTDEQIVQIKESVNEPINCYMCDTPLENAPGIGLFCPNKNCDVKDGPFEEPIEETKSLLGQHPYLNKPFSHFENLKPIVESKEKPIEEHTATEVIIESTKPYTELEGGYVMFEDKHYQKDALKSLRPDIFMVTADSQRAISTNFGIKFPNDANKGDVFVRVDALPNRVYKYDSRKWIEVQKDQSDTYLYNQNYIKYLVEKIEKGEYDLDLLSDSEKEQIELFLKNQK